MGRRTGGRLWDGSGSKRNPEVLLATATHRERWPAMGQLAALGSPAGPIGDRLWGAVGRASVKGLHFRAGDRLTTGSTAVGRPGT